MEVDRKAKVACQFNMSLRACRATGRVLVGMTVRHLWCCEEVTCSVVKKTLGRFGYITMIVKGMSDLGPDILDHLGLLFWTGSGVNATSRKMM